MDVLTSDRRRWVSRVCWAFVIGVAIIWSSYVATRLRATYDLQTQFAQLQAEHRALKEQCDRDFKDAALRLDYLEQVLFGEVLARINKKPPTPPAPLRIEPWLANAIKDIRVRLTEIERWRLERETGKQPPGQ